MIEKPGGHFKKDLSIYHLFENIVWFGFIAKLVNIFKLTSMPFYLYSLTEHRAVDASGSGCSKFWVWEREFQHVYFGSCPHCLLVNSSSPIFVGSPWFREHQCLAPWVKKLFLIMFVEQWFCGKTEKYQSKNTLHLPIKHMSFANVVKNDLNFGAMQDSVHFQFSTTPNKHNTWLISDATTPESMDGFQWIWTLQTKQTHSEPCKSNRSHFHREIIVLHSS